MSTTEAYRIIAAMRCTEADKRAMRKLVDKRDPRIIFVLRGEAMRTKATA